MITPRGPRPPKTALQLLTEQRDTAVAKLRRVERELAQAIEREIAAYAVEKALRLQLRIARAQRDALVRLLARLLPDEQQTPITPTQRGSRVLQPHTRPARRVTR